MIDDDTLLLNLFILAVERGRLSGHLSTLASRIKPDGTLKSGDASDYVNFVKMCLEIIIFSEIVEIVESKLMSGSFTIDKDESKEALATIREIEDIHELLGVKNNRIDKIVAIYNSVIDIKYGEYSD